MALALDSVRAFVLEATDERTVIVRFYNYNQIYPLGNIKSHLINKFVCMRGTVLRVSSIKVLVESIQF
jgi:DNA replicative helicase MCM subunit Mcm2 (Cdc46/Mcm family)